MKGTSNVTVVGFTTDGDVFGGFSSTAVTEQEQWFYDTNTFAFSFESHGRWMTPQRFDVKEGLKEKANMRFWKNCCFGFVEFYVDTVGARFLLGNEKSNSYCSDLWWGFEGLKDTNLTGKTSSANPHHCTRLVAIHLHYWTLAPLHSTLV